MRPGSIRCLRCGACGGEDAYVAVVDEHEDVLAFVSPSDAEVAELSGVAECDFAGVVDAVVSDAELAGVFDWRG